MKTVFRLEHGVNKPSSYLLEIIGKKPKCVPYVRIGDDLQSLYIKDKDLELLAVNILKALKSKKLK